MPTFRIKDLAINVASAKIADIDKICLFPTRQCGYLLSQGCRPCSFYISDPCWHWTQNCGACSFLSDGCGLNYSTCWRSDIFLINIKDLVINPADVTIVRQQMDAVLKAVQERGAEIAASMRPQTAAQIEMLEKQLSEALKELGTLKKEIK